MKIIQYALLAVILGSALFSVPAQAREPSRVAVMVHRPSNRLAWNAVDRQDAFMLGCDRVLAEYVHQTPEIRMVGAYDVNGIVRAMRAGLYYPSGDTIHEKWRPFLEADIYVDCELTKDRLQWRAGSAKGDIAESEVIQDPYGNPMKCAAALVTTVFEAAGVPLEPDWAASLAADEPTPPELFIEWAQWIGYRPHWLHHAPWAAPQASATRILKQDPGFSRGAAWALPMLMRVPKEQTTSPATLFYMPQALRILDSPQHSAAFGYLRKYCKDPDTLQQLLEFFGLPDIDMGAGLGLDDLEDTGDDMGLKPEGGDIAKLKNRFDGPQFRRNLVLAVGPIQQTTVKSALIALAADAESPQVRTAAVTMLARHHKPSAEQIRNIFATDQAAEVRKAAFAALVLLKQCEKADADKAAADPAAEVRLALANALPDCPLADEERRGLWLQMLGDEAPEVRAACLNRLRTYTDLSPESDAARPAVRDALQKGTPGEVLAALRWIAATKTAGFEQLISPHIEAAEAAVRAAAATALFDIDPERVPELFDALQDDRTAVVQRTLAEALTRAPSEFARDAVFELLDQAVFEAREAVCSAAYQIIGSDRAALARAMRFDPSLMVNLAAFRLARRLDDSELQRDLALAFATEHPNPYMQARALRLIEDQDGGRTRATCLNALESPFWVVRIEAADILSRIAKAEDAVRIRAAAEGIDNEWLAMALEDALCKAEDRPTPERIELNLGKREQTEGGDTPGGFQTWIDAPPQDPDQAREMVDRGWRFGVKNYPPNVPGGTTLNNMNNNIGMRNIHLIESILDPLENKWKNQLPYLYYIALFDEPFGLGTFYHPERVKAMLLEAGRTDLLKKTDGLTGDALEQALPQELQRAYEWYNAKFGGIASNWAVHMFRLTAQRKYPGLQIFPQSLSYMRKETEDAFNMIEADGDYSWIYHNHNFFGDGSIGAVNRVINPGKPLCMITWMGWHRPNIINGNTLYMDTNYPDGPWRLRNYMGTRSGLALWATGAEAAFFDWISFGTASNKDARSRPGRAFQLKPWSKAAKAAVAHMLDDPAYWKGIEGKLALKTMEDKGGAAGADLTFDGMDEMELDNLTLEEGPTPLEKALQEKKDQMFEKLMTGVSYMNIFNTDTTRALSNLPKPDTRKRDSLIIYGRNSSWYADGPHFRMPAIAVLDGFDMVPNYDCIGDADLMHYDTILLSSSHDGVTSELVNKINHWLRNKENGLLVVWGGCTTDKTLFPALTMDEIDEPFLWEETVEFQRPQWVEETYKDRRGRQHKRRTRPRLEAFIVSGSDNEIASPARVDTTFSGAVTPLLTTAEGAAVFARWNAPDEVKSVVIFDGVTGAAAPYTEAVEKQILAVDKERGATVKRNRWWGHTIYENDQFVVDVATTQFEDLHDARPRQHNGVDVITGVINPWVRHSECAVILKDYVGPYAGGKGNWAVLAREKLVSMTVDNEDRLQIEAQGVTRITRIGPEPIKLADPEGFENVENQVQVWKLMREGKKAYSTNTLDGGRELHLYSPDPVTVETGQ